MKKISKTKLSIIIAVIVAILIVGGVSAYLTDTDQKRNVFTVGSVKISLNEDNWDELNGQYVIPGQPIQKDPTIENIGRNSAYVYIKVVEPLVTLSSGTTGELFSYTTNSGWTELTSCTMSNRKTTIYYYNTALNPESSTNALFNTVTIGDYDQDGNALDKDMVITGYAIQSNYLPSGTTISSAYGTYFESSIAECQSPTTIYRFGNDTIELSIGQDITNLTFGEDYFTEKNKTNNLKFYLKHDISNFIVTKSYVCFNVTSEMKASNPGMTVGEYCLEGGDSGASYQTNKTKMLTAFGSGACNEAEFDTYSSNYCFYSSMEVYDYSTGSITIHDDDFLCIIKPDSKSFCGVYVAY